MKTTFLRKLAITAGAISIIASGFVSIAPAQAAPASLAPMKPAISFSPSDGLPSSRTGVFTMPRKGSYVYSSYNATVPFGNVASGDVLSVTFTVTDTSANKLLKFFLYSSYGSTNKDFYVPTQPTQNNYVGWNNNYADTFTYTHTVTAAESQTGVFLNFNTSYNGQTQNYWYPNIQLNPTASTSTPIKVQAVWKKNATNVAPSAETYSFGVNTNYMDSSSFDVDSDVAADVTSGSYGTNFNTGGCVNLATVTPGQTLIFEYALKKDGVAAPTKTGLYTNSVNLGWGVNGRDYSDPTLRGSVQGSGATGSAATGALNLVATQVMIDGTRNGTTDKNHVMGFNLGGRGLDIGAGHYALSLKTHVQGQTTDLNVQCNSNDVVNLKSVKTNGNVVVTFAEPGTTTFDVATNHYCQLREKATTAAGRNVWLGGVPAVEVTPSTSPKTFKCDLTGMPENQNYEVAIYNYLGSYGWSITPQYTSLIVAAKPDVSTDATATSIGIGTATNDVIFDPATLAYTVTSTDDSTPFPSVNTSNSTSTYVVKLNGTVVASPNPLNLVTGKNTVTIEITSPSGAKKLYTYTVNKVNVTADATLSALSFGSETLTPAFDSSTVAYSATVPSTTTTYPFPTYTKSQAGSTVVVKQGTSVVTGPGALTLVDGPNVVTVEVTAPNGTTKKTYTMTITKEPAAKDASLSALPVITGVTTSPAFASGTTSYTGSVSESTTTATVSAAATKTISGATTVYKLNGVVVTLPGTLNLRPGDNKLETIVTSSDGTTTKTYTETITRAVLAAGSSTDANDARLAVNPVPGASYVAADGTTVTGFDSELSYAPNVYTKNAPVNQTEVVLASNVAANSGATIVNEYSTDGGTTWTTVVAPATVPLTNGKTTRIRTTVTKGTSTKVYVTDVVSPAVDPTADVGPTEGDGDVAPKGIDGTGKFIASNDPTFQLAWTKATGKLVSQATGIYTGYIEASVTFTKAGITYTCTANFGTLKAMPGKTAAQKTAAMKMKTFVGKQFCIDKTKLDPKTTAPAGGFTKANFAKIKTAKKTAAELTQEKAALAALKGFTGDVNITVTRYRAWPTTMLNTGDFNGKGGKISVQIRNTKVTLN